MARQVSVIVLLSVAALAYEGDEPVQKPAPAPQWSPARFEIGTIDSEFGTVTAVTRDSITIASTGKFTRVIAGPGIVKPLPPVFHPPGPPRTFQATRVLAGGGHTGYFGRNGSHRLWDVKVGDVVDINWCKSKKTGADLCVTVDIKKRPGGMVPPTIEERARQATAPATPE